MDWDVIKPYVRSTGGLTKRRGNEQPVDKRSESDKAGDAMKQQ